MKVVYPVVFHRDDDWFIVSVPDCGIDTQGQGMDDAIYMARDAISLWCVCQQDEGRALPVPSDIASVEHEKGEIVTLVDADIGAYRRFLENRVVRKNVTIPARLNTFAEQNNINFSRLLKDALENIYKQNNQGAQHML